MKISVIIPTYNEEKVIRECLKSLSKQTYKEMEVIVVDDGSTDKTVSRVTSYESRVTLLRQQHMGPGAARNLGAKHAKSEILVFVDADMTFEPDFIKKLVKPILDGKTKGTFSKEEYLLNKENIWARLWNLNQGLPPDRMHSPNHSDTQKVFRAILKTELDKAGGFNEKAGYTDDWSLSEKLGIEAVSAPGAIFYHRNPETLAEVFTQARWSAKRRYKLGVFGVLVALIRVSLPTAVAIGVVKTILHAKPQFLPFKLVYDLGAFIGILEYTFSGKGTK